MTLQHLLLISLISLIHSCPTTYLLSQTSCTFKVSFLDQTCTSFSFNQCSYEACSSSGLNSPNNNCDLHIYSSSDWQFCVNQCCNSVDNYPQSADSISQCQTSPGRIKVANIIIGASFGFVVLVLIIGIICWRKNKPNFCPCCFKREQQQQIDIEQQPRTLQVELVRSLFAKSPWKKQSVQISRLNQPCSVCLENNPSLKLQCGHFFHRKCIIACMKRKQQCILCRSTEFNNISIYCQRCYSAYYETTLLENAQNLEESVQICIQCLESKSL